MVVNKRYKKGFRNRTVYVRSNPRRYYKLDIKLIDQWDLSDSAFRIFCYIASRSDSFVLNHKALIAVLHMGERKFSKAWDELKKNGFIKMRRIYSGWEYVFYEDPIAKNETNIPFAHMCEKQMCAKGTDVQKGMMPKQHGIPIIEKEPIDNKNTLYQMFVKKYFDWFKDSNNGLPPKMNAIEGKNLKEIIKYFRNIYYSALKNGKITEGSEDENILKMWQYILGSWGRLGKFYQEKTRLRDINSNLQNILKVLKDGGTSKRTTSEDQIRAIVYGTTSGAG